MKNLMTWLREHPIKWQVSQRLLVTRTEGQMLPPFWYGHAYMRWDAYVSVFYPIPLNYLVRWGMALMEKWNQHRSRWSWVDEQVDLRFRREYGNFEDRNHRILQKELEIDKLLRRAEGLLSVKSPRMHDERK